MESLIATNDKMANNMLQKMANAADRTVALAPKYFPNLTSTVPTPTMGNGTANLTSSMLDNMSKSSGGLLR
jgi:hypothetical protein